MITSSFNLTATERVLPKLALDFTTAILDPRVTFTRSGNTATCINSSGVITAINADLPRFDYNPTTLTCQGLLIEESRTNVLVNSLIDGTNLSTQSVTTTAVAYTLSFYGTGNIVLSGASTGTVTGTGVYPSRKTFTFTPTAGTLTLTVSGTVQYAQLEIGAFATSFIPTTTAQTRNADVATMTGTNFSDWYNASEGTFSFVGVPSEVPSTDTAARFGFIVWDNIATNSYLRVDRITGAGRAIVRSGGSTNVSFPNATWDLNSAAKMVIAYKNANNGYAYNGNASIALSGNAPTNQIQLSIGQLGNGGNNWCGHISSLRYWPQRLTNNENQAFSK